MFAIPAVVMEEQLGSYFFSPSLSDDESHCSNMLSQFSTYGHNQAVPGCRQGGRTRQWSWASAEKKKNPKLACCGREDRKAAESQSFAEDAREH